MKSRYFSSNFAQVFFVDVSVCILILSSYIFIWEDAFAWAQNSAIVLEIGLFSTLYYVITSSWRPDLSYLNSQETYKVKRPVRLLPLAFPILFGTPLLIWPIKQLGLPSGISVVFRSGVFLGLLLQASLGLVFADIVQKDLAKFINWFRRLAVIGLSFLLFTVGFLMVRFLGILTIHKPRQTNLNDGLLFLFVVSCGLIFSGMLLYLRIKKRC